MFASPHLRLLPSWIWLRIVIIVLIVRCVNCVIESLSFVEKGLSKNIKDCRFMTTNFDSTKMKIPLQPINIKGGNCLSFDCFEF